MLKIRYFLIAVIIVCFSVAGGAWYFIHMSTISEPPPVLQGDDLPVPPMQTASSVYEPTKIAEWDSEEGKRITMADISFELPVGWHGEVYQNSGGQNALIYKSPHNPDHPISISLFCPPDGKGLEAATRLSTEERSFDGNGQTHSVSLQKWTAPGNDPWYFMFVAAEATESSPGVNCLVHGSSDTESVAALQTMYKTIDTKDRQ